ncbi:hypothetical protein RvY_15659 [Ramazzottius varieornatus]|uniref:Uncharacterized protein n=1 Tax=Ramazzottius varieornatus TaxID=947166 RepID=A0A1D1VWV3_RAMVA|nr:hypothetical protein RvY_15659 [Ramazzottius varieornatus]
MNCYPYGPDDQRTLHNVNSRTNDPGIDLNPYLNFLLDINTDFPVVPNSSCPLPPSSSFVSNVSRQYSQATIESINSLPPYPNGPTCSIPQSKSYNSSQYGQPTKLGCQIENGTLERLDRLETKLAKIVETVAQSCASRKTGRSQSQTQSKETSDEEASQVCSPLQPKKRPTKNEFSSYADEEPKLPKEKPRLSASKSSQLRQDIERLRKKKPPKLIPPANFENEDVSSECDYEVTKPDSKEDAEQSLRKEITSLNQQLQNEKERQKNLEGELERASRELQAINSELNTIKSERKEKDERLGKLQSDLVEACREKKETEQCVHTYKKLSSRLTCKLEKAQLREQQLKANLSVKEAALEQLSCLQKENECLQSEIRRLNTPTVTKQRSSIQPTETDQAAVRKAVDCALKKATSKFTKFHNEEVCKLEKNLTEAQKTIEELQCQLQQTLERKESLANRLKVSCNQMEANLTTFRSQENLKERRVQELSAELNQSKSRVEEVSKQKDEEIQKLQKTVQDLQKECGRMEQMKETIASLHSENVDLQGLKQTVTELQSRLRCLEQERDLMRSQLEQTKSENCCLKRQVDQLESGPNANRDQRQIDNNTREELEKIKKELTAQMEAVRAKDKSIEDLQDTIQKLKRAMECTSKSSSPDYEHLKRRNRELEEVLERLEDRKEELKCQLASTETQLLESNKAHQIINAKWKEKSAYISRMQTNLATQQARFEVREEELRQERDEALEKVQSLERKLEEVSVRSRETKQTEMQKLRCKYEEQLAKKEAASKCSEQAYRKMEQRVQELTSELASQKKQLCGKFNRLGKFLQEFDAD